MNKVITKKDNKGNDVRLFDLGSTVQFCSNGSVTEFDKDQLIKILQIETPTYNEQVGR